MAVETNVLTGWPFKVEQRRSRKFFVVYPEQGREQCPAYDTWETANEIGMHAYLGHAFFTQIPTIERGASYPRPGVLPDKSEADNISELLEEARNK